MWLDPTFEPPPVFVAELVAWARSFNAAGLKLGAWETLEDHQFEVAEPALAHVAPELLADLTRKKLQLLASRTSETRYWGAVWASQHLLLTDSREADAARSLRRSHVETDARNETYVRNDLLMLELLEAASDDQHRVLTEADPDFVLQDLEQGLRPLSASYAEAAPRSPERRARDLVIFLCRDGAQIPESVRAWLVDIAFGTSDLRSLAFKALARSSSDQFARELLERDWSWSSTAPSWENHYGSSALIDGAGVWLRGVIGQDLASGSPWRVRRGLVLKRFTLAGASAEDAWPDGEAESSYEDLRRQAARSVARDGWARYWFRRYLAATTLADAYAAWKLFMHSADRRAWLWLTAELEANPEAPLRRRKLLNLKVNRSELQRMIEKRHDKLKDRFLDRKIVEGIAPCTRANTEC